MKGTGVSAGIGIAQALMWQPALTQDYVPRKSGRPEIEIDRFDTALANILNKNNDLRAKTALRLGDGEAAIFDAYAMMLQDEEAVIRPTKENIRLRSLSAEYAVTLQFGELARSFLEMDNEYMRQRAEDVFNLRDQLLREMMGMPVAEASHLDRPTIVVAHALTPGDLANLDISRLEGIVCETGGYSSHMSILSRTLGVPAVVGATGILECVEEGDVLALDGESGEIWVNPDKSEIEMLRSRADTLFEKREQAQLFRGRPTITTDGRRVELSANVGQLEEVDTAISADAESIGIYRTEILHISYTPLPSEEDQLREYRVLLEKMNGKAAVVRTFDDGGNRPALVLKAREEENPMMGYRGIRMCLGRPSFFRTQLRALLRASAYGSLKIIFPMISSLEELRDAKAALEAIKNELRREDVPFDEQIPVGILISVPSSALLSEVLASEVDFFSIGINDLIQFTLAVDRGSPDLNYLYHMYHPAVLRLVKWTVDAAHHHGIPCNICGEAQGYEKVLPLLLGLGLDGFSVNPGLVLSSRRILNSCSFSECKRFADETLQLHTAAEVERKLRGAKLCEPEYPN
ncbi:phosphoenolpyruvate--protein phosphotransferase [Ruminococcaceae bacterium OttesenSCG-928-I18]|nr:phosphoenolpyruvate--protein phosphotransferase [Ruminococcaceae bacterium OttesenSCG-928-I18]